jgi:hypothetical protein
MFACGHAKEFAIVTMFSPRMSDNEACHRELIASLGNAAQRLAERRLAWRQHWPSTDVFLPSRSREYNDTRGS